MINLQTGAIEFDDGLQLKRESRLESVSSLRGVTNQHTVSGRIQLSLGQRQAQSIDWGVGVIFVDDLIRQVWLQCLAENGKPVEGDWSLKTEIGRKAVHDRFLQNALLIGAAEFNRHGPSTECKFTWGKVSSLLDVRGVQALIVLEYS
jgi:hypothetical protein